MDAYILNQLENIFHINGKITIFNENKKIGHRKIVTFRIY